MSRSRLDEIRLVVNSSLCNGEICSLFMEYQRKKSCVRRTVQASKTARLRQVLCVLDLGSTKDCETMQNRSITHVPAFRRLLGQDSWDPAEENIGAI